MPVESIPLRKTATRPGTHHLHPAGEGNSETDENASRTFSSPVHVSASAAPSRQLSRNSSPFSEIPQPTRPGHGKGLKEPESPESASDLEFDDWDEHDAAMPSDLRPELERNGDGRANSPLLGHKADEGTERPPLSRRSTHTFHERDPESQARYETRRRYTYAGIFLALSLVSFTVQTETAVYIQHELKWEKPYCML